MLLWRVKCEAYQRIAEKALAAAKTDQAKVRAEDQKQKAAALREIAARMGCEVVRVYRDHGISGAKGRDGRPKFNRLCRDAAKRQFDLVMAWSVEMRTSSSGRFRRRTAVSGLPQLALHVDSLRRRISEAIGAKQTCRERREHVDLTKMIH